jgi:pimeloyl-ACP methyl ester carboxylesterase
MRRSRSMLRLGLVAALALSGLGGAGAVTAASAEPAAGFTPEAIVWSPCADNPEVECGKLTLPVDWSKPTGPTFELQLAKRAATDPSRRIGPLLINPGGPGGSGVNFVFRANTYFSPEVQARFDIIGFDPRGVNRSHPVVCSAEAYNAPGYTLLPASQAEFDQLAAYNKRLGEDCRKHTGPLFDRVDSIAVAHDIDAIRRALGEQQISWFGVSYGTLMGQMYAEQYPRRIRALVNDSNMDHSLGVRDFLLTQAKAAEDSFEEFVKWCGRSSACAFHGENVEQIWAELLARADAGELTDPVDGSNVDSWTLIDTALNTLDGPDFSGLADWLASLRSGEAATKQPKAVVERGSPRAVRVNEELVRYSFGAIFCEDWAVPVKNNAEMQALWRDSLKAAPNMRTSTLALSAITSCVGWPAKVNNPQHRLRVSGTPTLLMLNSLHDPLTGYWWALNAATQLGNSAVLVTYEGWGHRVYQLSTCARGLADQYLLNLTVPARGTSCDAVEPAVAAADAGLRSGGWRQGDTP